MLLANTCKAAIESLGDIVGLDMARKIVFAKMRHHMIERNGHLNMTILAELDEVLGHNIMGMNQEYLEAMNKATQGDRTLNPDWMPPQWRPPHWGGMGDKGRDMCFDHNQAMDGITDKILKDWERMKTNQELDMSRLKTYLALLVSNIDKTECTDGKP